jgi:SPP1 gp7 family putative phage head morphogenesis protein
MLQRLSGGSFNKLKPILEKLQKDIRARLSNNPTDFQMNRLTALMRDIQSLFDAANSEVSKQLNLDLEEFIPYETDFQYRMLGNAVTTELTLPAIEQVVAAVTTAKAELISGGVTKRLNISEMVETLGTKPATIENKIRAGVIEGKSVDQMVRDIMRVANQAHKRDVRTIVRTAFNLAGSEARQAVTNQNIDVISGEKWVSTLDGRTSLVCQGLDGKTFAVGDGRYPPAHMNCRSLRIPLVDQRYAVPGIKGKRSARDESGTVSQISGETTYNSWLKRQSAAFQDEVLGEDRAKLFRGGMNVDKFTDDNGRTLTLAELKSLDSITL